MSDQIALQQGDTGAGVLALQNALIQRGYSLPEFGADGAYGPETAEAVRSWKKDNATDLLSPIADGSYVTESELDLIGVSAVSEEGTVTSSGGGSAGEIILIGAAAAFGIILALDE